MRSLLDDHRTAAARAARFLLLIGLVGAANACTPSKPADGGSASPTSTEKPAGSEQPSGSSKTQPAASASAPRQVSSPSKSTVEVVAKLVDPGPPRPGCGIMHVITLMQYEVTEIKRGALIAPPLDPKSPELPRTIAVAVGCKEGSRRSYGGPDAGNVEAFQKGDVHHLWLHVGTEADTQFKLLSPTEKTQTVYVPDRMDVEGT